MEFDLTLQVSVAIASSALLVICIFFIVIFLQDIKEFKGKPLATHTAPNPEWSIPMSALSKTEVNLKDRQEHPIEHPEIILSPSRLLAAEATSESSSNPSIACEHCEEYEYSSQGIVNAGFSDSDIV